MLNTTISNVPGVYVNIIQPIPVLNGVPTNKIANVGTAIWGPKNSPTSFGNIQQGVSIFGNPQPQQYDLMTAAAIECANGANDIVCVRVTDGTDTAAFANLLDGLGTPVIGAILTSLYTGSGGNTIIAVISTGSGSTSGAPTYKLTISMAGGVPEVFDGIGGTGAQFWTNLINAVNLGQNSSRGKSQLVVASNGSGIGAVTIVTPGSYTTIPTLTASIGSGAVILARMKAVTATAIAAGGSGYVTGDTVTLAGGTYTTPTVLTITATTGAVVSAVVTTPGSYSVLPSNPVAQSTTSGIGTGATFTMAWGLLSAPVTNPGSGYTSLSALNISGSGGGAGTLTLGSVSAPEFDSYTLAGGTDGNDNITTETLIGNDAASPRTGMYALRNTNSSIVVLADADDPSYFTAQSAFGQQEGCYMMGVMAPGYQDDISGGIVIKQTAAINSYAFKLLFGDWVEINDTFNNQIRFVSPGAFAAVALAAQPPCNSSLNYAVSAIVATQKTAENRIYSDSDISQIATANMDVITRPIPASASSFGCRLGINTSSNLLASTDAYTRMNNYIALTVLAGMGLFIGKPLNDTNVNNILGTINAYLQTLQQQGWIGSLSTSPNSAPPPAFNVTLDTSQANTSGILIANVNVYLFGILTQLIINLNANSGQQSIQILAPTQA